MISVNSWEGIYSSAARHGSRYPMLVCAQWALESGWGKHTSGRNNVFGLKGNGSSVNTKEFYGGQWVTIKASFIDFPTVDSCVHYLVTRWYKDWKGYKGINNAKNIEEAARMLVSAGYATDPNYANKLLKIVSTQKVPQIMSEQSQYASVLNAAKSYVALKHQEDALRYLDSTLTEEQKKEFTRIWRSVKAEPNPEKKNSFPLSVPYFYQRDSRSGHGERMCQSSSIAMRIKQIDPTLINDDDDYLKIVHRFGDTVSQAAHIKALAHLELDGKFRQNGTEKLLCELLDKGISVPIGILHKGKIGKNVSGGGHWIVLIGYDNEGFYVNDPFGRLDLVNGGYPYAGPIDGKCAKYARSLLMKRWLISSQNDGWLWIIDK
jgi:hypothetical protein